MRFSLFNATFPLQLIVALHILIFPNNLIISYTQRPFFDEKRLPFRILLQKFLQQGILTYRNYILLERS